MSQKERERARGRTQEHENALRGYLSGAAAPLRTVPNSDKRQWKFRRTHESSHSWSSFSSSIATALKCQSVHTCLVLLVSTLGHIVQKSLSNPVLNLLILPVSANPYSSKLQNFTACHVETFFSSTILNL